MILTRKNFEAILDIAADFLDESDPNDALLSAKIGDIKEHLHQLDKISGSVASEVAITVVANTTWRKEAAAT
jgi:hypothetical protein